MTSAEQMPVALFETDPQGQIHTRNKAASALNEFHLGDRTYNAEEMMRYLFQTNNEDITAEAAGKHYLFHTAQTDAGFCVTATDVSSLIQRLHFYEDVMDNIPADLGVFSREFKYLYVNAVGIKNPELRKWIIGKTDREYCLYRNRSVDIAEARESVYQAILDTKKEVEFEEVLQQSDGSKKYQLRRLVPALDHSGEVRYIIGYGIDITKRILAEQAALKAAKEKQQFFSAVSHEIRTPMNAIVGLSRQLRKTELDRTQSEYVAAVNTASDVLLSIVNDLLDLSKADAGKLELKQEAFSLKELLHDTVRIVLPRAKEKHIDFELNIDGRIAERMISDPSRLQQILLNICGNAVKFTYKGSIKLSASMEEDRPDEQLILLCVKDSGIGMKEEFAERIFEPFTQEGRTVVNEGTGLGMAITKRFVDLMRGNIFIRSKENDGTEVFIQLRVKKTDLPLPISKPAVTSNPGERIKDKKIWVADDNDLNLFVAKTLLEFLGANVTTAQNGKEVLSKLGSGEQPDLILMDMQMPYMDGAETTKAIRSDYGNSIPVIALTANVTDTEKQRCLSVGMNDFLSKPFEEAGLVEMLEKWLS